MSTFVVDPSEQQRSGNISIGSCIQPVEQLPHAYWSEPGWQQPVGGDRLLIGSLEEWQMLRLDETCGEELEVVQVSQEEEFCTDLLEEQISASMWSTTEAPSTQSRFYDDPFDDPLNDLPVSPTYELQLQGYPLPEQFLSEELETEPVEPHTEQLSGSWLDTSYVDQLTNYSQLIDSSTTTSAVSAATAAQLSSSVLIKPDPAAVAADEVNDAAAEEVTAQLMEELRSLQQLSSAGKGRSSSSGPASLDSITGAELEQLMTQMFGGADDSAAPQWNGCLEDGSSVDPEVLWNVDSGYQTTATTSPSTSDILLTSDCAAISVGSMEDVITEYSVTTNENSNLGQFFLTTKSESITSRHSSHNESDDDYVDNVDYSDDDDNDSLSDEEFRPSSSHGRSYGGIGIKRRRRGKSGGGKRKRREEYALLTPAERRERKREQNKNAATKYREKKRLEEIEKDDACDELEKRNMELRKEVLDKEREVKVLRRLVVNIFRQPPNEVLAAATSVTGKRKKGVKKER